MGEKKAVKGLEIRARDVVALPLCKRSSGCVQACESIRIARRHSGDSPEGVS
jgi:hypothetical protein